MPTYIALTYTRDVDWTAPDQAAEMAEYREFSRGAESVTRGGAVLYPTSTATTVRVTGGKGGEVVVAGGPYADTPEALTGFYLFECDSLDDAIRLAAAIPAAWNGAVEVRPVVPPRA